jgi:hypothetical protein
MAVPGHLLSAGRRRSGDGLPRWRAPPVAREREADPGLCRQRCGPGPLAERRGGAQVRDRRIGILQVQRGQAERPRRDRCRAEIPRAARGTEYPGCERNRPARVGFSQPQCLTGLVVDRHGRHLRPRLGGVGDGWGEISVLSAYQRPVRGIRIGKRDSDPAAQDQGGSPICPW